MTRVYVLLREVGITNAWCEECDEAVGTVGGEGYEVVNVTTTEPAARIALSTAKASRVEVWEGETLVEVWP